MEIDNFDYIAKNVMETANSSDSTFWVVQLVLRKKDFPEGTILKPFSNKGKRSQEYYIRNWLIRNSEELFAHKESMVRWAQLTGGRLYFNLDIKDMKKVLAMDIVNNANMLANFNSDCIHSYKKNFDSVVRLPENSVSGERYVLIDFDMDPRDTRIDREEFDNAVHFLCSKLTQHNLGKKHHVLHTVSGYHVFCRIRDKVNGNVNTKELSDYLNELYDPCDSPIQAEPKYNSSTLLYYFCEESE